MKTGIMTLKTSLAMSFKDTYTNTIRHLFSRYTPRKEHLCALEDYGISIKPLKYSITNKIPMK